MHDMAHHSLLALKTKIAEPFTNKPAPHWRKLCVDKKKISTTLNYTYKMQSSLASYNSFLVMSNMFARYGARAKPFI